MADRKRKPVIWTVCILYPPNFSGAGVQAHREHCEFIKSGMPVAVLSTGASSAKPYRGRKVTTDGVRVRYLPVVPVPSLSFLSGIQFVYKILFSIFTNLSSLSFALECAWVLLFLGRRNDIVRFESADKFTIIPILIARLKRLHPVLRMSLFGCDDPDSILQKVKRGQILQYLNLSCFHAVEGVVAICSAMLESCRRANITEQKVKYIPNGVDTQLFYPVHETETKTIRQELKLDPHMQYILFVGAAIARKGIDVLIDAFIRLRQKMDHVELLVVGPNRFDNNQYDDAYLLQNVVEECGRKLVEAKCNDSVHWAGEVDNVHQYMKAADVFCFPTRQEGFPLAVLEAMACGLPVVVSYLEGITTDSISTTEVGIKIHGCQSDEYAEAMMDLFNHPHQAEQIGLAARSRVVSMFSLEHSVREWMSLFQKLTNG